MSEVDDVKAGEHGIKELTEAMDAFFEGGGFLVERLHDGPDLGDGLALAKKLLDKDFRAMMEAGGDRIDRVPAEVLDIKTVELEFLMKRFKEVWLPKVLLTFVAIKTKRAGE